jgi:hypothetical protein
MMGGLTELIPEDHGSAQAWKLIPIGLGQPTELVPVDDGWADRINSLVDGSAQVQELIPIGLGQPTELVPVDDGWADRINSRGSWVSPGLEINSNWIGSAHRISSHR